MADIKCPMCSKPNLQNADVCQYCGARITPVTAPLETIKPGETPTPRKTADLESTLPAWLRDARKASEDTPNTSNSLETNQNFFNSTPPEQTKNAPVTHTHKPEPAPASPLDFLAGLAASADDEDETPDWLANLRSDLPDESPASENSADTSLQDLMSAIAPPAPVENLLETESTSTAWGFQEEKREFSSEQEIIDPFAAQEDTPDWLNALKAQANLPSVSSQSTTITEDTPGFSAPDTEFPAWLSDLSTGSATGTQQAASSPSDKPASPTNVPDWLASLQAETPAVQNKTKPEQSKAPKAFQTGSLEEIGTTGTPDWLAGLGSSPTNSSQFEAENAPDWLNATSGEEPAFDLASLAEAKVESQPEHFEPELELSPATEASRQESSPIASQTGNDDSILSMDMPDWLAGFTSNDLAPAKNQTGSVGDNPDDIAPASLPSWVQAMRPVEAVVSGVGLGDDEQFVEKEGPLAGFRAVIPALDGGATTHKSKIYPIKLISDDIQQSQAALLDALLKSEGVAKKISSKSKPAANRISRWVVAAVLFLAVFIPSLLGTQQLAIPNESTSDLRDFRQTIFELNADAPVLLVIDYQPALAGEMEAALSPVLDDLMLKGARLTFISTSPTGSLMIARMMEWMLPIHSYQQGEQYIDLGYLPGDAAGIQVFANNPEQTKRHDGMDGYFWNSPPLAQIQQLSDFATLVIVTDNPDVGRIWIEQASPRLAGKPILAVISAQAEPMLRPYYDSGQITGIVTGLSGGAIYEQNQTEQSQNRLKLARTYWDTYGLSLVAIELLIIGGSSWSLVKGIIARRKEKKVEEA